jgi:hypothetical protein
MNYRKIAIDVMNAGYLDAPKGSKLHRVGLKVLKRKNRQLFNRPINYVHQRQNPVWLSAYNQ